MSEEYGITIFDACNFINSFLIKIIEDDTLSSDIFKKIFIEIINNFPIKTTIQEVKEII